MKCILKILLTNFESNTKEIMGLQFSSKSKQESAQPIVYGKIIDNLIIEYDRLINHDFTNVLPDVKIRNGITRIMFKDITDAYVPISELDITETVYNNMITLHVSPKKKKWFIW